MSQRFGRSKKRALREAVAQRDWMHEELGRAAIKASRLQQEVRSANNQLRDNGVLAIILRDARAQITGRTAQAIVDAESQFLRDALSQLRAQSGAGMTLEANPGPVEFGRSLATAEFIRLTVRIPPVYREFGVEVPRDARRRA